MPLSKHKKVFLIAAARPNFMKIAPLYHALKREEWGNPIIVHTGQHYNVNMSDTFFMDLNLPSPDINLGVGSGTHAEQTGRVMIAFEKIIFSEKPDLIIVVGDVNSTMACTITAVKLNMKVAHLEAGLRSFDRTMPEEINRIVTDALSDILWTPSPDADENLLREGIPSKKIVRVGNIMMDSLEMMRTQIENADTYKNSGLHKRDYGVVTLHRPSNVDDPAVINRILKTLENVSKEIPLVFPVHPRTRKSIEESNIQAKNTRLILVDPLSYVPFMNLVFNCSFVITDSGGLQEETTYLGIPCLTIRPNTERPITVEQGTNILCAPEDIEKQLYVLLQKQHLPVNKPEMWDGKTAERVVRNIGEVLL